MNSKAFILFLYGVALAIIMKRYYGSGNTGLPKPQYIVAPSYLYGVLAITSDFLEGLPVVLAAGVTLGLFYAVHPVAQSQPKGTGGASKLPRPAPGQPNPVTTTTK